MKTYFSIFWIRLTQWEYWPWYIVYIPVFIYWLWCGLKTRAIFWISAANPGFEYGGIVGASKNNILSKIPQQYVPVGFLIFPEDDPDTIEDKIKRAGLSYPVILKPDVGERGFHVELVKNRIELEHYRATHKEVTLVQEYLDLPLELGIFYYRYPNESMGVVSSIVQKGLLTVVGDGVSSIHKLMAANSRAKQQISRLEAAGNVDMEQVLEQGQTIVLEPIGNHVRGTMFINGQDLINEKLTAIIDAVSKEIDGFFYGRYDLRCANIDALYSGDFKIMELNGAASEPAHIYSPKFPILKGYRELFRHWKILYKISTINHRLGVPYMSFKTGLEALKKSRFSR